MPGWTRSTGRKNPGKFAILLEQPPGDKRAVCSGRSTREGSPIVGYPLRRSDAVILKDQDEFRSMSPKPVLFSFLSPEGGRREKETNPRNMVS